jgi:hypothetical protein
MASREPNNLRLPATSSSKLSGASTLTSEVSVSAQAAKDSRLCRSRSGDLSNTCKEAASAMAVLSFIPEVMPASVAVGLAATTCS